MSLTIGVMGAGAIGGFLAARLAAAGRSVSVLARGATRDALRSQGIRLDSELGNVTVPLARVSDDAGEIGPVDLCLFTVKGYDTEAAAEAMAPMIGPQTRVLSFQNGLAGIDTLADRYGAARVLAGVTYVPATVVAPGHVRHTGRVTRFVFGPSALGDDPVAAAFAQAGTAAGLDMELLQDPMPEIWAKFVMLAPFHALSATTRLPLGGWIEAPATRALYRDGMAEVAALAAARGVALPGDLVERNMRFSLEAADRRTRASMLDDLERGRPLELESSIGWLCREARAAGVATPIHDTLYALLQPFADGASVAG